MSKRTPIDEDIFGPAKVAVNGGKVRENPSRYLPDKVPGQVSARTRLARDLFLYGNGDGKPITDAAKLAEKAGVSMVTIDRWRPVWERERKAMLRMPTEGAAALRESVTAEGIKEHGDHVAELKKECEELKKVLRTLPKGTEQHISVLRIYTATLKAWGEESGLHDHFQTAVVAQREMIKLAAKQAGKQNGSEDERNVTPGFGFAIVKT